LSTLDEATLKWHGEGRGWTEVGKSEAWEGFAGFATPI